MEVEKVNESNKSEHKSENADGKERYKEKDKDRSKEKRKDKKRLPPPPPPPPRDKDKDKERENESEQKVERVKDKDKDRERKEKDRDVKEAREDRDPSKSRVKDKDDDWDKHREKSRKREDKDREKDKREKEREGGGREQEGEHDIDKDSQKKKDKDKEVKLQKDKTKESRQVEGQPVSTQELQERVAKAREERLKSQEQKKHSTKAVEPDDDLANWVNKSRLLEQKKREEIAKAARVARMLEEQDEGADEDEDDFFEKRRAHTAAELAGVKVRHGIDKVLEGGAVVLTLKDSNILADGDINEEADELENFEIAQQKAREEAYKAAKKAPGKYEDKFHNDMEGFSNVLPQYEVSVKEEEVVLDEKGGVREDARRRLEELRQKLTGATVAEANKQSLMGSGQTLATDYYTQEEMAVKFRKKEKTKKKKLRKRETAIDYDAMEAEAIAAGLGGADLASRENAAGRRELREQQRAKEVEDRKARYNNAMGKAAEASRALEEEHLGAAAMDVDGGGEEGGEGTAGAEVKEVKEEEMKVKEEAVDEAEAMDDGEEGERGDRGGEDDELEAIGADDDDELFKSLAQARQVALKKKEENGGVGIKLVAARVAEVKKEEEAVEMEGGEVLTDTGEFCRSLRIDEGRRARGREVRAEDDSGSPIMGDDAAQEPSLPSGWMEVKERGEIDEAKEAEEEAEEEDEILETTHEKTVGKGLAGALALLQSKGELKETVEWGGRNMDKKKSKLVGIRDTVVVEGRQKEIQLDRRDEFGRIMTPKEAFRHLSHHFHGKGSGKKKQEKRLRQYEEELKQKRMDSGDTPLMAMEKIREEQARLKAPYLVISGHIKPGQTSDPLSGFATVEKSVGSLTPMLGDKKVEYMLGIKRKEGAGSMGPPPPKKPKSEAN